MPTRRTLLTSAGAGLFAGLAIAAPACEDLRCCNSCGRNYYLGGDAVTSVAWIANLHEGGNECEIDGLPRTFEDADYVLRARVLAVDEVADGWTYQLEVEDFARAGEGDPCGELGRVTAEALGSDRLEVDSLVCVEGPIFAETMCTQLACALDS